MCPPCVNPKCECECQCPACPAAPDANLRPICAQCPACPAAPAITVIRPQAKRFLELFRQFGISCEKKSNFLLGIPDVLLVEVGAYNGEETKALGSLPNVKKVITYEATPSKIPGITSTIASIASKVTVRNAAVSDKDGEIELYLPDGEGGSQQDSLGNQQFWSGNANKIKIPSVRLDTEIHERIHLLKTDTQGNEYHVLKGAEKIIDSYGIDVIHMEYSPNLARANGENLVEMMEWLNSKGYACFDCPDHIAPKYDEEAVRKTRSWTAYPDSFGSLVVRNGDHGAWGDVVCIQAR